MPGMKVVVTGGSGFIGRVVVRQLAARGDQVVALVRSDLSDVERMTSVMRGADAVIHSAGSYRVGIPASERPAMLDANVGTTTRVLDAAEAAGVPRRIYVSTVGVLGNTHDQVVDETYRRDLKDGYLSYYDETKWLAHLDVERRIAAGAPVVSVLPGFVYGPGDHSAVGSQLLQAYLGTAPFVGLGGLGVSLVHVEDLAAGILAAVDRAGLGRAYILAGTNIRFIDAMRIAAAAGGRRAPRVRIPDVVLRIGAGLAPNLGARFGLDPNLREIVRSSMGVTFWASSARAAAELGYVTRDLPAGFADAFGGADARGPITLAP